MRSYTIWIGKGDSLSRKGGVFMRVHLPENGGVTMIENTFIDQFMPSSSGDFVKIYLYLLRCAQSGQTDISIAEIADALHYTESDVRRAMGYWQKQNCLDLVEDADQELSQEKDTTQVRNPEPAQKTEPDNAASGNKITEFRPAQKYSKDELRSLIFVAENYLGRPLSVSEQETLVYFITDLGMDIDLVDYLLDYCISMNHTSFHYIRKVAVNWAQQGISSVEQARKEGSSVRAEYYAIFRTLGIRDHEPTPAEKEYMDRWLVEYALSMELILLACRRTILQTGKARLSYADSILRSWNRSGVRTIADVEKLDQAHELTVSQAQASAQTAAGKYAGGGFTGRFLNFEPSGTDWNAVADSVMRAQEEQERVPQES